MMGGSPKEKPDSVLIDCHHAGISGDMLLGALIDLGASRRNISQEIDRCIKEVGSAKLRAKRVKRASISCIKVDFEISQSSDKIDMRSCLERASDPWVREVSLKVLATLEDAEAKVHGRKGGERHHLHELGQMDAVADIAGCLAAWRNLGLDGLQTLSTRIALGGGNVVFSHGHFPVPPPATLEILRGIPVSIGGERELTTPTGASLVVNLANSFVEAVDLRPMRSGMGAGQDVGDFLNATRIILGMRGGETRDMVDVLETNVDDVTAEALAHTTERLMAEGALDVSIIPSVMKKGRPGSLVRVIAKPDTSDRICDLLLRETGSLGARIHRGVERRKLRRQTASVTLRMGGRAHKASLKVGIGPDGSIVSVKPEYSDIAKICKATGREFPTVYRSILKAWRSKD